MLSLLRSKNPGILQGVFIEMSETYEITDDGTGEEIVVQRVICTKCNHYILLSPKDAAKIDDSWKCELCTLPEGITKSVRTEFTMCGSCGQVFNNKNRKCFCVDKPKPMFSYYHTSKELKNPVTKRMEDAIEEGKLQTVERKIVRNARKEEYDRKVRVDHNLDKNNIILQMIHNIPDEQIEEYKKTQDELRKTKKELYDVEKE